MQIITRSLVERLLPMPACIAAVRGAMIATSRGEAELPIRQFMPVPGDRGKMAIMPGAITDPDCFGIKLVCKYERPPGDPLGTHVGMVLLFDSVRGVPLAMIEGSSLTGIRTAAASGLATDLLARTDARKLAIVGSGEQAMRHIAAMTAVRPIEHVAVWSRDPQRTRGFAKAAADRYQLAVEPAHSVGDAVAGADIICTTTSAKTPVLFGRDLEPGQHVNLVGSAIPTAAEVDAEAVRRASYFVDYLPAAQAAAGELLQAIDKSLGSAAQDLAAAYEVWRRAAEVGLGHAIELMD